MGKRCGHRTPTVEIDLKENEPVDLWRRTQGHVRKSRTIQAIVSQPPQKHIAQTAKLRIHLTRISQGEFKGEISLA